MSKLVLNKETVRELVAANCLPLLVDFAQLAHLHTSRAQIHNQVSRGQGELLIID